MHYFSKICRAVKNQSGALQTANSSTDFEAIIFSIFRTIRWLDRCIRAHKRPDSQNLFPIVQGALDPELRKKCLFEILKRESPGYAIGGLSGGEEKSEFWKIVSLCTDHLPNAKPRYLMGVGWALDLVVCCALGADMYDCVFPTRTARFGTALTDKGLLSLSKKEFQFDFAPIEEGCPCSTCERHSRAYLHSIVNQEAVACHLMSVHNISYQMRLMTSIRESIRNGKFPEFVKTFLKLQFGSSEVPQWAIDALNSVNIRIHKNA